MVEKNSNQGTVKYDYTEDNLLKGVYYSDGQQVNYQYDALGRKVFRTATAYDLNYLQNHLNNGRSNGSGRLNAINNGNGAKIGLHNQLDGALSTNTTYYLYSGTSSDVMKEYGPEGQPMAEYYWANGQVNSRKMFGFHGQKTVGWPGNIRTRGGLLYYNYDASGNAIGVDDRVGDTVMNYRYDAFGNLFTDMPAPYNATGYTGKTYDPVAGLMDYSARWYSPSVGRFLTEDSYMGDITNPQSLNRYAYVMNNPVNMTDPSGHRAIDHQNGGGSDYGSNDNSSSSDYTGSTSETSSITGTSGSTYTGSPDWAGPIGPTDQLPDWVLNKKDNYIPYKIGDTQYLESWYFRSYSESESDTWLEDTIKTQKFYKQIYNKYVNETWNYDYYRYFIQNDVSKVSYNTDETFTRTQLKEWSTIITAKELMEQNADEIASYGAPPNAHVISSYSTLDGHPFTNDLIYGRYVNSMQAILQSNKINGHVGLSKQQGGNLALPNLSYKFQYKDSEIERHGNLYMGKYKIIGKVDLSVNFQGQLKNVNYNVSQKSLDIQSPTGAKIAVSTKNGLSFSSPVYSQTFRSADDIMGNMDFKFEHGVSLGIMEGGYIKVYEGKLQMDTKIGNGYKVSGTRTIEIGLKKDDFIKQVLASMEVESMLANSTVRSDSYVPVANIETPYGKVKVPQSDLQPLLDKLGVSIPEYLRVKVKSPTIRIEF